MAMSLVVCSQLLRCGQLWELQGMKSKMGALDLEPEKCCLTSHHSLVCYTASFTGGIKKYLCYYMIFSFSDLHHSYDSFWICPHLCK